MSKNIDKINKALDKCSLKAKDIDYMHPHAGPEMCGPEGGWLVETTSGNIFLGLNKEMLLKDIDFYYRHHCLDNKYE
jgi:hypothetical protein